jgi:hypothetical protein
VDSLQDVWQGSQREAAAYSEILGRRHGLASCAQRLQTSLAVFMFVSNTLHSVLHVLLSSKYAFQCAYRTSSHQSTLLQVCCIPLPANIALSFSIARSFSFIFISGRAVVINCQIELEEYPCSNYSFDQSFEFCKR